MTVSSTVELLVKAAQPVNALRQVRKEANKTNESFKKTEDVLKRVTAASNKVRISIQAQQKSLPKLSQVQGVLSAKVRNSEQAMRSQIKALRDLQVVVKFNGSLYNRLGAEIQKYETKLRSANGAADQAKSSNNGLGASLRRLAVGFGIARAGQRALQAGIQRDESERRLRLLTQRFGETTQAQEAAQRASDKFNLSQTEANTQLSRLIARLRPMGLSMQTIETAFAGFNTATILAGATASESAGAFLQLSQALGSGVLRGQELNSILEQAPLIAQAIATEMGSTVGALKKFGEEGKITSEIVIAALGRVEREGAGQLKEALLGPAAAIKDFQNAAEDVQVALTQDIVPEMAASFRELADLIESLGPLFRGVGGNLGGALGAINDIVSLNTEPVDVAAREIIGRGRIPSRGIDELFEPLGGKEFRERLRLQAANAAKVTGKDVQELFVASLQRALKTLDAKTSTLPSNFETMVLNAGDTSKFEPQKKSKVRTGKTPEEIAKEIAAASAERVRSLGQQTLLAAALTDEERKQFERQIQIADIIENTRGFSKDQLRAELEATFALHEQQDATIAINKANEDRLKLEEDQKKNAEDLAQKQKEIAQTIQNNVVGAITSAIDGSKSLAESFSGLLKQLAMMILKQKIIGNFQSLGGGGILGLIPGLADGGPARAGRPHIVGERGPELFVPNSSGTVVPNHAMGGGASVTVNVDASGSSVEGDGPNASQLGKAIGAAVQAELIKQKRPGGLLTR